MEKAIPYNYYIHKTVECGIECIFGHCKLLLQVYLYKTCTVRICGCLITNLTSNIGVQVIKESLPRIVWNPILYHCCWVVWFKHWIKRLQNKLWLLCLLVVSSVLLGYSHYSVSLTFAIIFVIQITFSERAQLVLQTFKAIYTILVLLLEPVPQNPAKILQ